MNLIIRNFTASNITASIQVATLVEVHGCSGILQRKLILERSHLAHALTNQVISYSNKEGLMRKSPELQDYAGKRAGGEHPDEAMSSKSRPTAFSP